MQYPKYSHMLVELSTSKLETLKLIRNQIIGSQSKKLIFAQIGLIEQLTSLLKSEQDYQSLELAVVIIGSLAQSGDEGIMELIINNGIIEKLLEILVYDNTKLKESIARTLKSIFRHAKAPKDLIYQPNILKYFTHLLNDKYYSTSISESIAIILANSCDTTEKQSLLLTNFVLDCILKMISCLYPKTQEAALDLIAAISRENEVACKRFADKLFINHLIRFLKDKRPSMRLMACTCLANLQRSKAVSAHDVDIGTTLIPILIKLIGENGSIKARAPLILGKTFADNLSAYLVSDSEDLQKVACEADVIGKLAPLVSSAEIHSQFKEAALLALAAVCSLREESRKQVIDAKILPYIVSAMEDENVGVRAAACQCTRSLSRSVKNLRTCLVDAGIATPLFKTVLEEGAVEKLTEMVKSIDINLRLNSLWALKNLLYHADSDIKSLVMKQLTFAQLESLMVDPEVSIQEQALSLLRNLACGKEIDIEETFKGMGEEKLLNILESKLNSTNEDVITQVLYIIVNIATGNERHKSTIMSRSVLLQRVLQFLSHAKAAIKVAAVWCVINLTWLQDSGSAERIKRLVDLDVVAKLKSMANDYDVDVRERVRTALGHFDSLGSMEIE